jgi:hypothetical protein
MGHFWLEFLAPVCAGQAKLAGLRAPTPTRAFSIAPLYVLEQILPPQTHLPNFQQALEHRRLCEIDHGKLAAG